MGGAFHPLLGCVWKAAGLLPGSWGSAGQGPAVGCLPGGKVECTVELHSHEVAPDPVAGEESFCKTF